MAQYPGNAGQKITLGEQTTADGLVWRGRTSDTSNLMTNKIDTSAYLVLDTITEAIWLYLASTTPKWNRVVDSLNNLQGQLSLTTKVTGVLPVANGGTGENMSSLPNNYLIRKNSSGIFDTAAIFESGGNVGIGTNAPTSKLDIVGTIELNDGSAGTGINPTIRSLNNIVGFSQMQLYPQTGTNINQSFQIVPRGSVSGNNKAQVLVFGTDYIADANNYELASFRARSSDFVLFTDRAGTGTLRPIILSGDGLATNQLALATSGNVGIGTASPAVQFHTTGGVRFATFAGGGTTTLSVDNTGNLARTSSIILKKDVIPISHGLNEILQIKPINFNWIDEDKFGNENENGFIAEDVMNIIPNVVAADSYGLFMDYTKLIPILTKAIQEQQALIKALEQRILILENK